MSRHVSEELRRLVADRADDICEYCLIHNDYTFFGCEVDHVISLKHSGSTEPENLAYACSFCNRFKGSDVAALSPDTGEPVRLFNPRIDRWAEHFQFDESRLRELRVLVRPPRGF